LSLFKVAVVTQIINAIGLPLVFYFLIKLTSNKELMGDFVNNRFQKWFAITCTVVIVIAAVFTVASAFFPAG
jgi:manganese transport protein